MSSAVRSKIASYEAHNKQVSNGSPSSMAIKGSVDASTSGSTSTAVAAQNRVSRMRQEQMTRDGKSQQSNIVEKRKLLKERRMLQQKRTPASDALGVSIDKRVNLSRRTEYSPAKSEPSLVADQREKEAGPRVTSPGRQANRLSKMQRMQKMKGYDPSKKAANAPAKASVAASSTASTATTAVAHNSANKAQPLQRRQRTTLMQSRAKRVSNVQRVMPATPETPASDVNVNIDPMSPQPASRSFSHLSAASPNSEFDTYGATDHSVEPTTDDEATLTSVRRIMTRDNVDEISKREKSHHYHHLQAQSTRGDDSINASHRSGRTMQASQFALGSLQPKGAAKLSISGHTHSRPDRRRKWSHEGKSDKIGIPDVFRAASSSDYDTDGDISKTSRQSNALDGPSQSQATDVNDFFARSKYANSNRRMDDDDRTFDYGDRDDDSNGSNSFEARRRREAEQHLPENIPSKEWRETEPQRGPSSLINKDDVEHYTRSLGSPAMKIGVGVIGAVTVGCIVLGPAGLLAGAACIGFGVGVMQIPDEEREKIQAKMQKTVNRVHEKAVDATESLSNSCAATYEESGVAEHLPPCLSLPVAGTAGSKDHESTRSEKRAPKSTARETMVASKGGQKAAVPSSPPPSLENGNPRSEAANSMERLRNKKVACLRNGTFSVPLHCTKLFYRYKLICRFW